MLQGLHPSLFDPTAINNDDIANTKFTAANETAGIIDDPTNETHNIVPTPKRGVTFGTHDQIHQWDEQLDVLRYVNEEFFNVAHFLIEVVGVDKDDLEEYKLKSSHTNDGYYEDDEEGQLGSGGVLSRLFSCGIGGDVHNFDQALQDNRQQEDKKNKKKQYHLSKKLVDDFVSAVKFRMENIKSSNNNGSKEEEETDGALVAARTREVARKINAYGLPLLPFSGKAIIDCGDIKDVSIGLDCKEGDDKDEEEDDDFLDTFGQGIDRQFFPVLPVNDDEADENDESISKQLKLLHSKSQVTREDASTNKSTQSSFKIPTPTSILSSLFQKPIPKSSTPSEDECQTRLIQIRHETKKAQRMISNTSNKAVQSACHKRISKLKDERRFYQIIQERYKIQSMLKNTHVESVRVACRERMKQLIYELEMLKMERDCEYDNDSTEEERKEVVGVSKEVAVCDSSVVCTDNKNSAAKGEEDTQWYDRVFKYVNGREPPLNKEEMSVATVGHSTAHEREDNNPEHFRQEQQHSLSYSQGHDHRPQESQHTCGEEGSCTASHYSLNNGNGSERYHDDRHYDDGRNRRRVLSPKSDTANNDAQNNVQYTMGKSRRPVASKRPVAHAVNKSSWTPWIG